MQTLERLAASDLVAVIESFRDALRAHQAFINRLNVYPVPDGDTGTNMALTAESVVQEIERRPDRSMATVAAAISYGSLMGARGNSGVILSQILRGLADAVKDLGEVGAEQMVDGLRRAADGAYSAVQNPVEGTILTVIRAAADGAAGACNGKTDDPPAPHATGGCGLISVLEAAHEEATAALARTPEMLPVLKAAGVVDSGGTGLVLLLDAMLHVAAGRPLPEAPEVPQEQGPGAAAGETLTGHAEGGGVGDLRYEVMYLLEAPDELIPAFREVWAGIGDSIVVVGGDGLWNCHIHTDDIGAAIEAALEAGRPQQIRVTDLFEEVEEEKWVRAAAGTPAEGEGPEEAVRCSVVAVCTGDGIRRIFRSLGVHHVVSGGQSMNPSTADLLEAIDATNSEQVVILPNNKNIIPVAEQAARQAAKPVRVIPTKGIQEGFAALLEYDPEGDADSNASLMAQCAERVVAGEVTRAVRPSSCDAGPIAEGDFIGISRERIEVVAPELADAATALLERLVTPEHEIITVFAGEGSSAADTRRITEWLAEQLPDVTAECHHGGQPLYPYLFSIE
ncbi:MAG TPA: DAK2 domain-containing protein [Acidimicrobiales bacterium]|nr:DAK2 domain-containing protein [Acidimicrobiales bacterium]